MYFMKIVSDVAFTLSSTSGDGKRRPLAPVQKHDAHPGESADKHISLPLIQRQTR
jgi:hypothetical protein